MSKAFLRRRLPSGAGGALDPLGWWSRLTPGLLTLEWGLYLVRLLAALLPAIYTSTRLHLLGELPEASAVSIASQVAWLGVAFEVLQELLILPLYFTLGATITSLVETRNKMKTGLLVLLVIFACASAALYLAAPWLVEAMAQASNLLEETTSYIRLEIFGFFILSISRFLEIPLELMKLKWSLLASLLLRMALTVLLDVTFLSSASFSLQLGVQGVAYSSLLTSTASCLLLLLLLGWHLQASTAREPWRFA